jgi:hypothetical protein
LYFTGVFCHPRVKKSVSVSSSRIASHIISPRITSFVSRLL